jgi:hypothetical protein
VLTLLGRGGGADSAAGVVDIATVMAVTTPAEAVAVRVNRDILAAEVRSVPQHVLPEIRRRLRLVAAKRDLTVRHSVLDAIEARLREDLGDEDEHALAITKRPNTSRDSCGRHSPGATSAPRRR